jgi:hypothetical protein
MSTSRISAGRQVGFLYLLAVVWNATWIVGLFHSKAFLGGLPLICGILFFFIPILYFYGLFRIAFSERPFIAEHPLVFFGSIGIGLLPPAVFLISVML